MEWRSRGPYHFSLRHTALENVPLHQAPWPAADDQPFLDPAVLAALEKAAALHGSGNSYPHAAPSLDFFARIAGQAQAQAAANAAPPLVAPNAPAAQLAAPAPPAPPAAVAVEAPAVPAAPDADANNEPAQPGDAPNNADDVGGLAIDLANIDLNNIVRYNPLLAGPALPPRLTLTCPPDVSLDLMAIDDLSNDTLFLINLYRFDEHASVVIASVWRDSCRHRPNNVINPVRFVSQLMGIGVPEHIATAILDLNCLRADE